MKKKEIKIFIGSSIVAFEKERLEIERLIRNISDCMQKNYEITVTPILCENIDKSYSGRKQDEYNEYIKDCDYCYFIFFDKAGKYTVEELNTAKDEYFKNKNIKIYTYFKNLKWYKIRWSRRKLERSLKKDDEHYFTTFSHIDTVKKDLLYHLMSENLIDLKIEDGCYYVDGQKLMPINNLPEFSNSDELSKLNRELYEINEECNNRQKWATQNREQAAAYRDALYRKNALERKINNLQNMILGITKGIAKADINGEITSRQRQASELLGTGDIEGAIDILSAKDLDYDFDENLKRLKNIEKELAEPYIDECLDAIKSLEKMDDFIGRLEKIEEIYSKAADAAASCCVKIDTVYNCAKYYYNQNQLKEAEKYIKKFYYLYNEDKYETGIEEYLLYSSIGIIFSENKKFKAAEVFYEKGIKILEQLVKENPQAYEADLAWSCNNIGALYDDIKNYEKAEKYHLKAIEIRKRLAERNPQAYEADLASSCNNIGNLYYKIKDYEKAEKYYLKAIEIRERLAKENPQAYEASLATSFYNIGLLYGKIKNYEKAEKYYLKVIEIWKRLSKRNPQAYEASLANSCNNIGVLYEYIKNYEKSEKYHLKAIEIDERLAKENPQEYEASLALSCNNIGLLYDKLENYEKAEKYHLKALEIRERLAERNPQEYEADLAKSCNNIGVLYDDIKNYEKSEKYHLKAIEIDERLAKENPQEYEADLASSYYNYYLLCDDVKWKNMAVELAKKHLEDEFCRDTILRNN